MHKLAWVGVLLTACSGAASSDAGTTDDNGGTEGCGYAEADDLPEVRDELSEPHACEDAPYYDPGLPWTTIWYAGDFHIDDCGAVTGVETWEIGVNEMLADAGMTDCQIVYNLSGSSSVDDAAHGDLRLTMTATVDEDASTCVILGDQPIWMGYGSMELIYDVSLDSGGDGAAVYFESGNLLGRGYGNSSHVNYLSEDFACTVYTTG